MDFLRNFGHNGPEDFVEVGINAKNSEFHAAMGLVNFKYLGNILESRKIQSEHYDKFLSREGLTKIEVNKYAESNYAYYPIIFGSEELTLKVQKELEANKVLPRRYFHPSLNTVELYRSGKLNLSEDISKRILCLPLYHALSKEEIDFVCRILLRAISYK